MAKLDPVEQNVLGVRQLINSTVNKLAYNGNLTEGVDGEFEDEFTLKLPDSELLALATLWENKYRSYEGKIKLRQDANKAYYLGRQNAGSSVVSPDAVAGNLLFEAEETFLPAALSKNPEPVVWCDNTEEGNKISSDVKTMLQFHADILVLRKKLSLMTRHWSIYFLGCLKHGWDNDIKEITTEVIDPRTLILDPDACIDSYGDYDGKYIGERKTCTADELIELFPSHKEYITIIVDGKLGTDVVYTEWSSNEYCFYTFKGKVLDKYKNPHFKYSKTVEQTDIDGNVEEVEEKGFNHFAKPKKPYTFLSVFSLGEQPHDVTSLIEQNIPNQNLITKRTEQINRNLDRANNSIGLSENNFTQETAKQAAQAMEKGNPVLIPGGNISEAIARFPAPSYPDSAFKQLEISKQDLRSIFGTEGISSQQPNDNTTARGMILNQQFDNTRIGGGIGDALAQVADNVFNWWVQLYCVYYDEAHFASIMGKMKAVEYVTLRSSDINRQLIISVAPDSMKPKDEITIMNQAMSLWEAGALDPKTLLTMLNIPDPQKTAESTVLWLIDKNAYLQLNFPELAQKLAPQQGVQGQPSQQGQQIQGTPAPTIATDPASAALSNIQLPQ